MDPAAPVHPQQVVSVVVPGGEGAAVVSIGDVAYVISWSCWSFVELVTLLIRPDAGLFVDHV